MNNANLTSAFAAIDEANSKDPHVEAWEGKTWPKELLYSHRMTEFLTRFHPDASEALQLAARAQHICRWEIPRDSFPTGKKGYLSWRNSLKTFHANKMEALLSELGYEKEAIERVRFLLLKKQLKKDAETQILEDVICLVFIQYYLEDFSSHYTEEKLIPILQKTWNKMSEAGRAYALQLKLSENMTELISKALHV